MSGSLSKKAHESVKSVLDGARKTCEIAGYTFGPNGRNVAFRDQARFTRTIKDGVKVIQAISSPHVGEQMGIDMVRDGSQKTAVQAGDGTTSTAVMTGCLLDAFVNEQNIRGAFDHEPIVEKIRLMAKPVALREELVNIATISANNRKDIGEVVGGIVWEVGKNGVVSVEKNGAAKTETEITRGYLNDGGSMSPLFLRERRQVDLQDALVVIVDQAIENVDDITPLLQQYIGAVLPATGSPLVIVCHNMVGSAMSSILKNVDPANFPVYVVKSPERDPSMRYEMLDDLRVVVGTKHILSSVGGNRLNVPPVSQKEIEDFRKEFQKDFTFINSPEAKKAFQEKLDAAIVEFIRNEFIDRFGMADVRIEGDRASFSPKVMGGAERVEMLQGQLAKTDKEVSLYKALEDRVARMLGATGKIKIWAQTETELSYNYELYDDAVRACSCALRDGSVVGAGVVYDKAFPVKGKLRDAVNDFLKKLDVKDNVVHPGEDVREPATVAINVVRNSFSIAEQLLNTSYAIY